MNKTELVAKIAEGAGMSKVDAKKALEATLDAITAAVKAGDKVRTGQSLGTIDTINGQTQLHFQVWQGTKPQNPESWLK